MDSRFNNFQLDLSERAAVPRSLNFDIAFKSAKKLKDYLWTVIHNEKTNRTLYYRLVEAGFNRLVLIKDQALEILPGKFLKVYFVLRKEDKGSRGRYGLHKKWLFLKESRIIISLYTDVDEDRIIWTDDYVSTIDHELTHAFQSMDIAVRYLYFKNRHVPNYTPSYDDIIKFTDKVNEKNMDYNKSRFKDKDKDPEAYLNYLSSSRELGARAHSLLRALASKDKALLDDVISYCEQGWPDFDFINRKLSRGNWVGWRDINNYGKKEIEAWGIREEETYAYELKQELLIKLYGFYKIHYKQ